MDKKMFKNVLHEIYGVFCMKYKVLINLFQQLEACEAFTGCWEMKTVIFCDAYKVFHDLFLPNQWHYEASPEMRHLNMWLGPSCHDSLKGEICKLQLPYDIY